MEPVESCEERSAKRGGFEVACVEESMAIATSCSSSRLDCRGSGSGRTRVPSDSCLNIRLTAMIPAAPVSAARSAPT